MNNELYTKRRDELLMLLDETISIGLPKIHDATLREIYRKCQEDQFEIALVGEFQGGKSTTFNALCDGREISPRGLGGGGLKTSAAIVTAQHISDPHEQKEGLSEWAEVRWRSSFDIIIGFADLLKKHLAEDQEFQVLFNDTPEENRIDYATPSDLVASFLNLHNPQHRAALHRALEAEWNRWANDKRNYEEGDLDQLRIATLQLRFHDTEEWRELCSRTVFPIAEFQQMITFPRDWTKRFNDGINAPFEFKDAVFVFIADVLVRLRAANLGRIGCRITDCPGLFVSDWDTQLARIAMYKSDAIWYLFNGGKQIGDGDKQMINFIQDHGWTDKLRATLNLRNNTHENIIEMIKPEDESILGSMGLEDLELHPYDARLAFLACQGDLLLTNPAAFGEWDRQCMAYDFDSKMPVENLEPPKAWQRLISKKASVSGLAALENINRLDVDTVQEVKGYSYLDSILKNIENLVIEKKAYSILVCNGSHSAAEALKKIEGNLRAKEEAAELSAIRFQEMVDEAENVLTSFVMEEKNILKDSTLLNAKYLEETLADDLKQSIITHEFALSVSVLASRQIEADNDVLRRHGDKKIKIENVFKDTIYKVFCAAVKTSLTKELDIIRQCKNETFKTMLSDPFNRTADRIERNWAKASCNYTLLNDISNPNIGEITLDEEISKIIESKLNDSKLTELIKETYNSSMWNKVVAFFNKNIFFIGDFIVEFRGDQAKADRAAKNVLRTNIERIDRIEKIRLNLHTELMNTFVNGEGGLIFSKFFVTYTRQLCNHYSSHIYSSLNQLKVDFESRVNDLRDDFYKSNAERTRIAEESRQIRTQKIAPARQRINDFEAEVLKDLGKVALS